MSLVSVMTFWLSVLLHGPDEFSLQEEKHPTSLQKIPQIFSCFEMRVPVHVQYAYTNVKVQCPVEIPIFFTLDCNFSLAQTDKNIVPSSLYYGAPTALFTFYHESLLIKLTKFLF